jgi:hypothetical protein
VNLFLTIGAAAVCVIVAAVIGVLALRSKR